MYIAFDEILWLRKKNPGHACLLADTLTPPRDWGMKVSIYLREEIARHRQCTKEPRMDALLSSLTTIRL